MYWLIKSSIGKKLIMSISGIFLFLFLLFHMSMNLIVIFSSNTYDIICKLLGSNWYAVIGTWALSVGIFIHILYGILLTCQNKKAKGSNKYLVKNKTNIEWSSRNMFVLGLAIFVGLIIHLCNFWVKMQLSELLQYKNAIQNGSFLVIKLFSNPIYSCLYIVWFTIIWLHLTHGIWSAVHTIGLNGKNWFIILKRTSNIVATIILVGFSIVPLYFMIHFFYENFHNTTIINTFHVNPNFINSKS